MTQDVYNLVSFIMFLGVRRNPQTNICSLKAIKHVDSGRDLGIVLTNQRLPFCPVNANTGVQRMTSARVNDRW